MAGKSETLDFRDKKVSLWRSSKLDLSAKKTATCDSDSQVTVLVEAAGIEPASRDIFMKASTCVVDCLILARPASNRQDAGRAS